MKKQLFITLISAFLTILTAASVSAQAGKTARVNLEFDFYIGETIYPAGAYVIEAASRTSDNILQIRSVAAGTAERNGKKQLIISNVLNAGKQQQPKLVFRRAGTSYFLSQIFLEPGQWGFSLSQSRKQKEQSARAEKIEVPVSMR